MGYRNGSFCRSFDTHSVVAQRPGARDGSGFSTPDHEWHQPLMRFRKEGTDTISDALECQIHRRLSYRQMADDEAAETDRQGRRGHMDLAGPPTDLKPETRLHEHEGGAR